MHTVGLFCPFNASLLISASKGLRGKRLPGLRIRKQKVSCNQDEDSVGLKGYSTASVQINSLMNVSGPNTTDQPTSKSGSRKRKGALSNESDFENFNKENKGNNHISCMLDSTVVTFTKPQKKRKTKPSILFTCFKTEAISRLVFAQDVKSTFL